ncbi:hypothetical protein C8R47DRAFT_1120784 [Mycena vitilis]|nr:hypothetical protein C8R47DRAFT_1120784 [Mycena vitilis]
MLFFVAICVSRSRKKSLRPGRTTQTKFDNLGSGRDVGTLSPRMCESSWRPASRYCPLNCLDHPKSTLSPARGLEVTERQKHALTPMAHVYHSLDERPTPHSQMITCLADSRSASGYSDAQLSQSACTTAGIPNFSRKQRSGTIPGRSKNMRHPSSLSFRRKRRATKSKPVVISYLDVEEAQYNADLAQSTTPCYAGQNPMMCGPESVWEGSLSDIAEQVSVMTLCHG